MTDTTAGEGVNPVYVAALDTLRKGAPGLSDRTRQALARSINMKVSLAAQPSAGAQNIAWVWTKKGSDTDGDPIIFDGTFGDYRSRVVLSRTDRSWSAIVNNGHGKSGMPSEHAAMAYAEETVAKLLKGRLEKARECVALYATPAQPDTGDVAALREARAHALAMTKKHGNPDGTDYEQGQNDMGFRWVSQLDTMIAALSKPNAPGREG